MTEPHPLVETLERDAAACAEAETEFRRTMKVRADALGRERALAHRRLNVMRGLFQTVEQAETAEFAVAGALAALRKRVGWVDDSPARDEVLDRFGALALAAFAAVRPVAAETGEDGLPVGDGAVAPAAPAADPREALEGFERWYEEARGRSFWTLFEHYMPETQLVDF